MENNFNAFNLDFRVLHALREQNYHNPTEIQKAGLKLALDGENLLIRSKTGSGKTAIYLISIVEAYIKSKSLKENFKAIIFAPTNELCQQIFDFLLSMIKYCDDIKAINVSGAEKTKTKSLHQFDIIIGTPQHILDILMRNKPKQEINIKIMVFDEADLLFSHGHAHALDSITNILSPSVKQNFVLSATLTDEIEKLCSVHLFNPKRVIINDEVFPNSSQLSQYLINCEVEDKYLILYSLITLKLVTGKTIIFTDNLTTSYKLLIFMKTFSIPTLILNSELPETSRIKVLNLFKRNKYSILICTDTDEKETKENISTSRGIDFLNVENVINFDFPPSITAYIHRVGRTARFHAIGMALTMYTCSEQEKLSSLREFMSKNSNTNLLPFKFRVDFVEKFRYRVDDAIHSITKSVITNVRRAEIKEEIFASQKVQEFFKNKPQNKLVLKSDVSNRYNKYPSHLKKLPDYLIPSALKTTFKVSLDKSPHFTLNRRKAYMQRKMSQKRTKRRKFANKPTTIDI